MLICFATSALDEESQIQRDKQLHLIKTILVFFLGFNQTLPLTKFLADV